MSLGKLKVFRIIVPGIIILLYFVLIIPDTLSELSKIWTEFDAKDTIYTFVVIVLGFLYHILKLRFLLWKPQLVKVQNNIKDTLLKPFLEQYSSENISFLKKDRKLMNVFYHFVDNKKSISEKSNLVRFNGLIWTSLIDIAIISFLSLFIIPYKHYTIHSTYTKYLLLTTILVTILSYILSLVARKSHLKLSDDQLEIITEQYKKELKNKLDSNLGNNCE